MLKRSEFLRLQTEWYAKISTIPDANGEVFKEIEDVNHRYRPLKRLSKYMFQQISDEEVKIKLALAEIEAQYFRMAELLLDTYDFKNETHRKIWELHCQGLSKRKIANAISTMPKSYKRESIGLIIKMIAKAIK